MTTPTLDSNGVTATETTEHSLTGAFRLHENLPSRFLNTPHTVQVYLPPGYESSPDARYPVLYLHDGQNLFDRATAFGGTEWSVDETAQRLIVEGAIEPIIIVGIHNAGAYRIEEYTPTRDKSKGMGGRADAYGRMLIEELKPFIDAEYRTRPEQQQTGLGGSSLGALVSMYLALKYPTCFSKLAIISPSVWWDNRFIVRRIKVAAEKAPQRIWLSMGTAESADGIDAARRVRDALVAKGFTLDQDLKYVELDGATHDEQSWAAIVEPVLRYLYGRS